jgi:DUF971 family protein
VDVLSIRLHKQSRLLEFEWADGAVTCVTHQTLREACRCAECEAGRQRGGDSAMPEAVEICDVEACGAGAVRLHFSDGHARGIYPFAYMRELALI